MLSGIYSGFYFGLNVSDTLTPRLQANRRERIDNDSNCSERSNGGERASTSITAKYGRGLRELNEDES
jgi:hypothetical protein